MPISRGNHFGPKCASTFSRSSSEPRSTVFIATLPPPLRFTAGYLETSERAEKDDSMLTGQLALMLADAFAGAGFYVNFAEHRARLTLDDKKSAHAMEAELRRRLRDAGNARCRLRSARFARSMDQWGLALDRWRPAYTRELALYPDRDDANKSATKSNRGDRRGSNVSCHARVIGAAACRPNGAWPYCNFGIPLGPALNIVNRTCRLWHAAISVGQLLSQQNFDLTGTIAQLYFTPHLQRIVGGSGITVHAGNS
jgi:hypothetical protein